MKLSKSELEAVIAASTRCFVPFNKLILSAARQARPESKAGAMPLPELAASIHAAGLLHNLIVVRGRKGVHEVCAGGRRLRAMAMLVADGRWPENQPVPVLVVAPEQALLSSLIGNVQREAMHPADEFAAFARLVAEGRSVEDVAAAFGVTPLVVARRLKLAAVSPRLLDACRAERIGLDCLMLLASVDGHERQEELWSQLPEWARNADQLRRLLRQGEIESDRDSVARFVTVERYEAAGGALRRDLFSDDVGKAWLLDAALLERLAIEALQDTARQLQAEGWRWVDVRALHFLPKRPLGVSLLFLPEQVPWSDDRTWLPTPAPAGVLLCLLIALWRARPVQPGLTSGPVPSIVLGWFSAQSCRSTTGIMAG